MPGVTKRQKKVYQASTSKDAPPIPFSIEFTRAGTGKASSTGAKADETVTYDFEALGDVGAGGMLAMTSLIRYDPAGNQRTDLNGILRFFRRCMIPEQFARLQDLLDDQSLTVDIEVLTLIFRDLVDDYTGRPS